MNQIFPITYERHAGKGWRQPNSLLFAASSRVLELVPRDVITTAMYTCCAFVADADGYLPVALLGLDRDQNLFVDAAGRWLGRSLPAVLNHYPFKLGKLNEGRLVLSINEASGLLVDSGDGTPFFGSDGSPSEQAHAKLAELVQFEKELQAARNQCKRLEEAGLLEPWPLQVQQQSVTRTLEGLYKINEAGMNALAPEEFAGLRDCGALILAYGQLFSMQHVQQLGRMAQRRAEKRAKTELAADLGNMFNTDNGTLSFDNL
jgi:hypothetical protein